MSKVALITGGQRGIGLGIAKRMVADGFRVALLSPEDEASPEVQQALEQLGETALYIQHDVRAVEHHGSLLDRVEAALGPITALISNAAIPSPVRGDMLDVTPVSFDLVMGVNARGAFFLAQAVAKRMLETSSNTYRSLVFIGSVSAQMVSVERAEYCLSKSMCAMMASLFAVRLADQNIGVFEVRPGIIETPMTAGVKDKYDTRIADGLIPARRWGQPEDVASIVMPLVRGDMAYATGSVIGADGGLGIPRL